MTREFSFVANCAEDPVQPPEHTLLVLTYELAKVVQCHREAQLHGSAGFNGHAQTEMADVISMTRMFCEQMGIDEDGLVWGASCKLWGKGEAGDLLLAVYSHLGKVIQAHHYTRVFGSTLYHDKLEPSVRVFVRLCASYAATMGWDWIELVALGEEHYMERMTHIRESGIRSKKQ